MNIGNIVLRKDKVQSTFILTLFNQLFNRVIVRMRNVIVEPSMSLRLISFNPHHPASWQDHLKVGVIKTVSVEQSIDIILTCQSVAS